MAITHVRKYSVFAAVLLLAFFSLVGCSSPDKEEKQESRKITVEESQIFSRALVVNSERKSSTFTAITSAEYDQEFSAAGSVHWDTNQVSMDFSNGASTTDKIQSIYGPDNVLESYTNLSKELEAEGFEPRNWVRRSKLPDSFKNDALSEFLLQLTSSTPENPLLVRQDGTKVVGTDTIDDDKVTIFEKSGSVQYYIANDSTLRRVKVRLEGYDSPLSITFSREEGEEIFMPQENDIYPIDEVENFYLAFRPGT